MRKLQLILAVPMALTVLACLWLLYRQIGLNGLWSVASLAVLVLLVLSLIGWMQRKGRSGTWLLGVLALGVAGVALAIAPDRASVVPTAIAGAEQWSDDRVAGYVREGRPVFVYFTADWCLTCKANEAAAIDRDEVRDAFKKAGVKVLAGDWTSGDPQITRFLESRGRAGVPLYLWYEPGGQVEELPQILTPPMLTSRAQRPRR